MGLEMDSIKGGSSREVDIGVLLRWSSFVFVANENSWLRCCSRFAETLTRGGWFPRSYVVADYVTGLISSRPSLAAIRARSLVAPLRDFAPCCRRTRSLDQTASIVRSQIATRRHRLMGIKPRPGLIAALRDECLLALPLPPFANARSRRRCCSR